MIVNRPSEILIRLGVKQKNVHIGQRPLDLAMTRIASGGMKWNLQVISKVIVSDVICRSNQDWRVRVSS